MEEHIRNKMMFGILFFVLIVFIGVVFTVAIKMDREAPIKEPEDIDVLNQKIQSEYESGNVAEEEEDIYTEENGISFLADRAIITFTKKTSRTKALTILGDFADAYEYDKENDKYEVLLRKDYSYQELTKYCQTIINSYTQVTDCELITK